MILNKKECFEALEVFFDFLIIALCGVALAFLSLFAFGIALYLIFSNIEGGNSYHVILVALFLAISSGKLSLIIF